MDGVKTDVRNAMRALLLSAICLGAARAGAEAGSLSFESFALEPATFRTTDALRAENGEARNLVLLGRGGSGSDRFAVYAFEQRRWRNVHEGPLPAGAVLADTMRIGESERVVLFAGGNLTWLDPADWQPKPLAVGALSTIYRGEPQGVAVANMARDVNGDGLDDIVLADFNGIWLALQEHGGAFAEPVKAPIAPAMNLRWSVSYTVPRMYSFDYDGDGGGDFAVLRGGRLRIFANADIAGGAAELALPGGLAERRAGDVADSRLKGIADYNGDGIVDVCVSAMPTSGNPMDADMRIDFYFVSSD